MCELPVSWNTPRLYGSKIIYETTNENDANYLSLFYYDLKTGEEKVVYDKTSECYQYDELTDHIDNYDVFYYDGDFYMWYPETTVKINEKGEETILKFSEYDSDEYSLNPYYEWLTYEEYIGEEY